MYILQIKATRGHPQGISATFLTKLFHCFRHGKFSLGRLLLLIGGKMLCLGPQVLALIIFLPGNFCLWNLPIDQISHYNPYSGLELNSIAWHTKHIDKRSLGCWKFTLDVECKKTCFNKVTKRCKLEEQSSFKSDDVLPLWQSRYCQFVNGYWTSSADVLT